VAEEQRTTPRRVLKTRVLVALDGLGTESGKTTDLGMDGVGITMPDPVESGKPGYARFSILFDGEPNTITARVRTKYCIFSQGEYKVGLQFLDLDQAASVAITRYLR
jgi:hypothetical protein